MADLTHLIEKNLSHILPNNHLNFIVIGAGGTGGHLLPNLIRQISLVNRNKSSKDTLLILDADIVEEKNLTRQNFTKNDLGKNKAEVMATRYGTAFQYPVSFLKEYLETPQQLVEIMSSISLNQETSRSRQTFILVDCTDNNKTRLILSTVHKSPNFDTVFLSSGNEKDAGQIVCSFYNTINIDDYTVKRNWQKDGTLAKTIYGVPTPDFFDIFPDTEIDKLPNELSCAENALSAPQDIATNITAATILFSLLNKMLNNIGINELAIFFDSKTLAQKVYRSNATDLKNLLSLIPNNAAKTKYLHESFYVEDPESKDNLVAPTWEEAQESFLESEKIRKEKLQEALTQAASAC